MKLSELFKKEENPQLEKRTLVILRWMAIVGQLFAIYIVYFTFKFNLPILYCSLIIFLGGITNVYLQFWFKKNELQNLDSTLFLFYDLLQLSFLLYLTGGIKNPFVIFLIVPSIVSSTLLTLKSTFLLAFTTVIILLIVTFYHLPLPHPGDFDFIVPNYYLFFFPHRYNNNTKIYSNNTIIQQKICKVFIEKIQSIISNTTNSEFREVYEQELRRLVELELGLEFMEALKKEASDNAAQKLAKTFIN